MESLDFVPLVGVSRFGQSISRGKHKVLSEAGQEKSQFKEASA